MTTGRLLVSLPDEATRDSLGDLGELADTLVWDLRGPAPADTIDVVVPPYLGAPSLLEHLAGVRTRLVQGLSLGYDGVAEALPPGHRYANAVGVYEGTTAELAVALILASERGIADFVRASDEGRWEQSWRPSLQGRRVLLVGYGGVGRAIEERLIPFDLELVRVARHQREDERGVVYGEDRMAELLSHAEIVVVAVPLNEGTTRLVDAAFLAAMPDGALLVNVARGRVADTDALVAEAVRGRLRLALDVVDPEPLPHGHPLFGRSNVLLTPHVGGATTGAPARLARLLRAQVERLARGEEPDGIVVSS